jgi:hypothetical protein
VYASVLYISQMNLSNNIYFPRCICYYVRTSVLPINDAPLEQISILNGAYSTVNALVRSI